MLDSGPLGRLTHADYSRHATDNIGHVAQLLEARLWTAIKP